VAEEATNTAAHAHERRQEALDPTTRGVRGTYQPYPLAHTLTRSRVVIVSVLDDRRSLARVGAMSLHDIVRRGDTKHFLKAVNKSVDINTRDGDNQTPLHVVAYEGHVELAQKLLDMKADPFAVDKNNWTALHCAASSSQRSEQHLEIVELLLRAGS